MQSSKWCSQVGSSPSSEYPASTTAIQSPRRSPDFRIIGMCSETEGKRLTRNSDTHQSQSGSSPVRYSIHGIPLLLHADRIGPISGEHLILWGCAVHKSKTPAWQRHDYGASSDR